MIFSSNSYLNQCIPIGKLILIISLYLNELNENKLF